jgi:hypothetical protein
VISSLAPHVVIALLGFGHDRPAETLIEVQASSWWACAVEYERSWYVSDVFSGDGPASVYEAVFARFVEDTLTGHYRAAGCWEHASFEEASARLHQETATPARRAEPTGWRP